MQLFVRDAESYTGALVTGRRRRKANVWHRGLWLCRAEQTNERAFETLLGVFLTRSVRRLPEQRGAKDLFELEGVIGSHVKSSLDDPAGNSSVPLPPSMAAHTRPSQQVKHGKLSPTRATRRFTIKVNSKSDTVNSRSGVIARAW